MKRDAGPETCALINLVKYISDVFLVIGVVASVRQFAVDKHVQKLTNSEKIILLVGVWWHYATIVIV